MGAEVKGETRELGVTGAEVIGKERATELGEVRVASPDNSSGVRGSGMGVVIQESWKMSAIIKKNNKIFTRHSWLGLNNYISYAAKTLPSILYFLVPNIVPMCIDKSFN